MDDLYDSAAGLMGGSSRKSKSRSSKSRSGGGGADGVTLAERLTALLPYVLKVEQAVESGVRLVTPVYTAGRKAYDKAMLDLAPYGPEQLIQMATGLTFMFFGGFFMSSIAVYEATSQSGREQFVTNMKILGEQAREVREANDEDDVRDDDGDGIADVEQISKTELSMRKTRLVLATADPEALSQALGGLYAILLAVTATLRVKFARAVSLGIAIGDVLSKSGVKYLVPMLKNAVPEDLQKWIDPAVRYTSRLIGVSIAMSIQRVLSTVHTALRGARLTIDAFTTWCEARNLNWVTDGYLDDIFVYILAVFGIIGQIFVLKSLPLVIQIIAFPATITETVLSFLVAGSVSTGTSSAGQAGAFSSDDLKGMAGI